MNKIDIKNKLDSVKGNSQYVRVFENHPLELYLGKNENGYPTLRYNGNFSPAKIVGSGLLEVKQVKTTIYNSILFCFTSKENISLFYSFCEDIINQTKDYYGDDGYTEIINRYNQWKKMFYSSANVLTESEILGLIGELIFLKEAIFKKYGINDGLKGWSGPEPTHKDFSYKDVWYEIKSIHSSKNSIRISSIEQLDSDIVGHLVVFSFEKMSPTFNGISLNSLVMDIMSEIKFDGDKDYFIEKMKQARYSYNDIYDNFVYNLSSRTSYLIDSSFPRIKRAVLPLEVDKVQYDIVLSNIEKFKE